MFFRPCTPPPSVHRNCKNGQSGERHNNGDILKLQGGDVGRESRHDTGHLPWSQVVARRPHRAAVAEAVVLLQSAHGIRG